MYNAQVVLASENESGQKLVTFEVTFPRFILAEVNTHLIVSKCSASSRAIPTEKILEVVKNTPFVPVFNQRVTGMGIGDPLTEEEQLEAQYRWNTARHAAIEQAEAMLNLDKSRVNRMLEPYMWHTAILSATNWRNFLALRCPDGDPDPKFKAQIEFQELAVRMRDAYLSAPVQQLKSGDYHIPYVTNEEVIELGTERACMVSAGRLARVSYANHDKDEPVHRSLERAETFIQDGHWSTMMHQGYAQFAPSWSGNFYGFTQFRKTFMQEHDASYKRLKTAPWLNNIK